MQSFDIVINYIVENGVSFGATLAIVISYVRNESIFWAIIHGFLGWFYVLYILAVE